MSTSDFAKLPTDELVRRRGELAQGLQHAALEGLPLDDDDTRTVLALDAELRRRGMDPQRTPVDAALG